MSVHTCNYGGHAFSFEIGSFMYKTNNNLLGNKHTTYNYIFTYFNYRQWVRGKSGFEWHQQWPTFGYFKSVRKELNSGLSRLIMSSSGRVAGLESLDYETTQS